MAINVGHTDQSGWAKLGDLRNQQEALFEIHEEVNRIEDALESNTINDKISSYSMSGIVAVIFIVILIFQMKNKFSWALDSIRNRAQTTKIPMQSCQIQPQLAVRSSAYTGY